MKPLNPLATPDHPVTLKMIRNRGLTPVRCSNIDGKARHGWIVSKGKTTTRVQLFGEKRPRNIKGDDRRLIEEI